MDRFTELETFVAVAETGGFNAAARRLGRSAPTVTRVVGALEARIGARLFLRTTRQVALTETGTRLLQDARVILEDLNRAEAVARGAHEEPQGVLSVTAPLLFGRRYIAPLLRSFAEAHPKISTRALFLDRNVNLIEEGLDVALRIGDLPDSTLSAVRVGEVRRVTVASADYLARFGRPETPEDLQSHRLAMPTTMTGADQLSFVADKSRRDVLVEPVFRSNTIDAAIDAALAGWGITRVLSYQVADDLGAGRLVEVLDAFEDRAMPVHLVHAEGPLRSAKIRAFVDHAAAALRREAPAWVHNS